ncbi:lipid IV(A) 3-deoxy-D-manno-octulosonic acid transferase [Chitinilyticum aquatile]|uniref:lipid IV(A) 3-deoxy-D-manno-octulosonic acid transferase n=1 Tax=Chitinilyticum aquatile TaxID=362520 RepID=UPI0004107E2E|nr:lipid IV(A) 3-deoxy-D-manno-octulosonic acid transferase [Chitinilyticum aquatile]
MARALYRLALWLAFPLIWLYLLRRARKQPAYREHWRERLGFYDAAPQSGPCHWIHAVSVGEMRAAAPVVQELLTRNPDTRILLTCMTPTGRATAAEVLAGRGQVVYLPYDYPGAVSRFLQHWRPQLGLIMETEIWPNLIHGCADAGVPLYLGNARLSEKSARGYSRVAGLVGPALARCAGVLAQSDADAARLTALGARDVQIMGSVKFDTTPDAGQRLRGQEWSSRIGKRPVLLLASSREGEEVLLLDALTGIWPQELLLVLIPRHPQRFDTVAELLQARGLRVLRRSEWNDEAAITPDVQVLLGDSMGEMTCWYAAAAATAAPVLMGGSLLPFGSQNLIEPCAQGVPVVLGPSTFNFAAIAEEALAAGAARQGESPARAIALALALLSDEGERKRMAEAGLHFAAAHRGATRRLVDYLLVEKAAA